VADEPQGRPPAEPPAADAADESLAARLAEARRRVAELDLPAEEATRLHRQFIAVCDAVKAPGADDAAAERRLTAFMAALERAERGSDPRI
jgi:hypothetical protein